MWTLRRRFSISSAAAIFCFFSKLYGMRTNWASSILLVRTQIFQVGCKRSYRWSSDTCLLGQRNQVGTPAVLVGVQSCSRRSLIKSQQAVNATKVFCVLFSGMYVGFVTRELLDQSAAVRVTGTQGFDGETPRGKPFGRPKRRWECIKKWVSKKYGKVWSIGGIFRQGGTKVVGRKHVPKPIYPPKVPHELARDWPRTSMVSDHGLSVPLFGPKLEVNIECMWTEIAQYSDSLGAGRSGDRNSLVARFSAPVQTGPGAHPALSRG